MARPGHIPGARNLDWTATIADGKFLDRGALEQLTTKAGPAVRWVHERVGGAPRPARGQGRASITRYAAFASASIIPKIFPSVSFT